jgi:septal ring factor EnvC (AmiA/AmiB activator)
MGRITFFVLSTSGAPVRQITISKLLIYCIFLLIAAGGVLVSYGIRDYRELKTNAFNTQEFQKTIHNQKEILGIQRQQIQTFAEEINLLKDKLLALNSFETQIRVIANLEHPDTQGGLFGIGGSSPEDLDPKLKLTEKHTSLIREMHEQMKQLNNASLIQQKGFESLLDELKEHKTLLASTPAIRPANGLITSVFGRRESPFTGSAEFHNGLDIAARPGTPVKATADGKIIFADTKGPMGKVLIIDHGYGVNTRYGHLQEFLKNVGDTVKRGEEIALLGNTGRSTGPHVHYEVSLNGVPVNPQNYILD